MVNKSLWDFVISYYESRIEEGFDFSSQLDLVKQLSISHYADFLHPSTSHFTLILSPVEDYKKKLNFPSIALQQLDEQTFEIAYSPRRSQTHNVSKRNLPHSTVQFYLESLILKLKLNLENIESD